VIIKLFNSFKIILLISVTLGFLACDKNTASTLVTIADAREHKARFIDTGISGNSVGDIHTFDQPLLDENMKQIGSNSGICIRTQLKHSFQCQWTLQFKNGSIQVAGRELEQGISHISIIGGTGIYTGIVGEMQSHNNNDGTFTQSLRYWLN
jgi:dirigent-like protein